uniref:Uncharacterized protein n=1 Tax=Nelumbo nucifera TaxID=4432 RepID=A0A822YPQ5_NELNU|nr:TPA_asm: hypothetical protein HUJ06_011667 [Nelumbo nucifera]
MHDKGFWLLWICKQEERGLMWKVARDSIGFGKGFYCIKNHSNMMCINHSYQRKEKIRWVSA